MVSVPSGDDEYMKDFAMKVVKQGGVDKLARMLCRMADRQVAHLISSLSRLMLRYGGHVRSDDYTLWLITCRAARGYRGAILQLSLSEWANLHWTRIRCDFGVFSK